MGKDSKVPALAALALAALMIAFAAVGVTYAQQRPMRPAQAGEMGMARGMRGADAMGGALGVVRRGLAQLNLTTEQRSQIRAIIDRHREEFRGVADKMVPARRALADAIAAGDEAVIRQRVSEMSAAELERALLASRVRAEVVKILTPEQQEKLRTLRERAEARADRIRARRR